MESTTVYPARVVRTMDSARPTAEAVAVRGERVRAVGSVAELMVYPGAVLDERYSDAVLLPGFVEAHSHAGSGNVWANTYVGLLDRIDPDGRRWPGCRTINEVLDRLRAAEAELQDPGEVLMAWGLDPIYFPGQPLTAAELDRDLGHAPHPRLTHQRACVRREFGGASPVRDRRVHARRRRGQGRRRRAHRRAAGVRGDGARQ